MPAPTWKNEVSKKGGDPNGNGARSASNVGDARVLDRIVSDVTPGVSAQGSESWLRLQARVVAYPVRCAGSQDVGVCTPELDCADPGTILFTYAAASRPQIRTRIHG